MAFPVPSLLSLHSESLAPGESTTAVMGINFCDSTQAANFQLWYVPSPHAGERAGWRERGLGEPELDRVAGGATWRSRGLAAIPSPRSLPHLLSLGPASR